MNRIRAKNIVSYAMVWVARTILALMCACSNSPVSDGGGSRGGNPVVVGTIVTSDGRPAENVRVSLISTGYNSITDPPLQQISIAITDPSGFYSIEAPDSGKYTIEAQDTSDGSCLIRFAVETYLNRVCTLSVDTLKAPGTIRISLPENNVSIGSYVYLPGTSIGKWLTGEPVVTIDKVPAGTFPVLYYSTGNSTEFKVIRFNIPVKSNEITLISNLQWENYKVIILNTSPSGADITGDVFNFPVLIRLNSHNFTFTQALSDGSDILFTDMSGKKLPFEISRWDASGQMAEIWVKVDTVYGHDSTQSITMYWGNPVAIKASNSTMVFDTAAGFEGVWHLEEKSNDPAKDATANSFNGTASCMFNNNFAKGAVGNARVFDGDSSYIIMPNTRSGKLNYPEDGNFTVSAWVYADTLDKNHHTVVSKGFQQYFLQLSYLPAGTPNWELSTFSQNLHWRMSNFPAAEKKWIQLTGVKQGNSQFLFCNGELVAGTSAVYTHNVDGLNRDTTGDLTIGRFLTKATFPVDFGYCYFNGMIDEVHISSIARDENWVKLSFMNQRSDDRLVLIK